MGLDMFLTKKKKDVEIDIEKETYEDWKSRELLYWRKANAIHKWFVDNIQDGKDDCNAYPVSREKLVELRNICNKILNEVHLVPSGKTYKVYDYKLDKEVEEPEMLIDNFELCDELLPTQEGFFFGGTSYDEYYYDQVKYTRDGINEILEKVDFDEFDIEYESSW